MGVETQTTEKRKKKQSEKTTNKNEAATDGHYTPTDVFGVPVRECVKPEMQLSLTEAELEEEIAQMLTANNPEAPQNLTRFHAKERTYKLEAMVNQCITHYATDGWLIGKNSEEGRKQLENERLQAEALAKHQAEVTKRDTGTDEPSCGNKQLRNQFNFSDRECQTTNLGLKHRSCYTEPPQTTSRNGSCSQWEIYDAYKADLQAQQRQEQTNKRRSANAKKVKTSATFVEETESCATPAENNAALRAAKIMERMTVQNVYDAYATDFKYWDDVVDTFRPNDASLLPLWKFQDPGALGKQVTAICSNSRHSDVFAVGYGSYDALQQTYGCVNVYSIKNPTVPETHVQTQSGVLAVAFHPEFSDILAAGCYDGSVRIMTAEGTTLYASENVANRHTEPVWQVTWRTGTGSGELQLYSASTDGKLALWTFTRSEQHFEPLMTIINNANDTSGVLAIDFSKADETVYLAGAYDGCIYRCCTEYDSEYLDTYMGHDLPICAVRWNPFHKDVFLSASEDWTVQIWDVQVNQRSLLRYELTAAVTDLAWAPYSSTVFAAVSTDGLVYAFDIGVNRHSAMCEQKVVAKGGLTTVMFHPKRPLLLVGDSLGNVISLKLSPNLRKIVAVLGEENNERERLDSVLDIARISVA